MKLELGAKAVKQKCEAQAWKKSSGTSMKLKLGARAVGQVRSSSLEQERWDKYEAQAWSKSGGTSVKLKLG